MCHNTLSTCALGHALGSVTRTHITGDGEMPQSVREAGIALGVRVRITSDIDLDPHGVVKRGEMGTVVTHDEVTGYAEIELDEHHEGLNEYRNRMWIIPPYAGEVLRCLEVIGAERAVCVTAARVERADCH